MTVLARWRGTGCPPVVVLARCSCAGTAGGSAVAPSLCGGAIILRQRELWKTPVTSSTEPGLGHGAARASGASPKENTRGPLYPSFWCHLVGGRPSVVKRVCVSHEYPGRCTPSGLQLLHGSAETHPTSSLFQACTFEYPIKIQDSPLRARLPKFRHLSHSLCRAIFEGHRKAGFHKIPLRQLSTSKALRLFSEFALPCITFALRGSAGLACDHVPKR